MKKNILIGVVVVWLALGVLANLINEGGHHGKPGGYPAAATMENKKH